MGKLREPTPYGKSIKHRLVRIDMTQNELAELIGTSYQYLAKIIYGERSGQSYTQKIEYVLSNRENELNISKTK